MRIAYVVEKITIMQSGQIRTDVDNIFPIIKKFLYSDQEIFLRELVSNAVDATQKLKTLSSKGEVKGELGDLRVEVKVDKEANTITISDMGIGMTEDEVNKYINQIAFSSAQEFLDKYQDDGATVIGHFGLGFYSAFMVANKVEIQTLSYKEGSKPVSWECEGDPNYKIGEGTKTERGTDIILHIADDAKEYLEDFKIEQLLTKYCKFLPVEIKFGENENTEKDDDGNETTTITDKIINNPSPAWTKKPAELTDEDYKNFYRELYPYSFDEPLFWIHLNVDYPFNLTGILYFPKLKNNMEVKKDKISLYCNQVFVTDNVEEIIPEFLGLMHGVIDSPDIPLNVSRSYLQSDPNVKRISSHITKKVASKLEEIFKKDRAEFEGKWEDIGIFLKYGILSNEKFADKVKKITLVQDLEDKHYTIDELKESIKETQTDKEGKTVVLYTTNTEEQHSYIESCKDYGYQVTKLNTIIDPHFVGYLDQNFEDLSFKRVDADVVDKLVEKDETKESVLNEEQETTLKGLFGKLTGEGTVNVELKPLSPEGLPVMITKPELMRRFAEMNAYNGMGMGQMPETYNLVVNSNHPIMGKILVETDEAKQAEISKQLYDLALLSQNMLKGADLTDFIKRSVGLVK